METTLLPFLPRKTILVVEDNKDCRQLQTIVIRGLGYVVIEADNGAAAIDEALAGHPDLILMDLGMPKMNGEDAIVELKTHSSTRDIPIIVCTAFLIGPRVARARDAGAVEILHKPYKFSELQKLLRKYVPHEVKSGTEPAINIGVEQH
jgi:two-component system KDP operon response regulator KdpE